MKRFCVLWLRSQTLEVRQFQFHFNLHCIEVEFIATALTIGLSPLVVSTAIYNAVRWHLYLHVLSLILMRCISPEDDILIQYDMYVPAGISPTSYTAGISNPLVTIISVIYYMNNFHPTYLYLPNWCTFDNRQLILIYRSAVILILELVKCVWSRFILCLNIAVFFIIFFSSLKKKMSDNVNGWLTTTCLFVKLSEHTNPRLKHWLRGWLNCHPRTWCLLCF